MSKIRCQVNYYGLINYGLTCGSDWLREYLLAKIRSLSDLLPSPRLIMNSSRKNQLAPPIILSRIIPEFPGNSRKIVQQKSSAVRILRGQSGMIHHLMSLGLLFFFAYSGFSQGNPIVAVLRDSTKAFDGAGVNRDSVILLDSQANPIKVIAGVGVSQSISSQNQLLFDAVHRSVLVAENTRGRVSVFGYDGDSRLEIPIENVSGIFLSPDSKQIGCVVGFSIDDLQTVIFDAESGKEIRRLKWGGVALTTDVVGSQLWAVGRQLIGFDPEGGVTVRRPLTQLPAEPLHPTVINSRNWCAIGVAIQSNKDDWGRRIWVAEQKHTDVRGSRNRLFAVGPDGQTRILVELDNIDPRSIACATYQGGLNRILIVDRKTGDLVSFDSDGKLMGRDKLDVQLVAFGENSGLWVAGRQSIRQLDPSDLSIVAEHKFIEALETVGLAVH